MELPQKVLTLKLLDGPLLEHKDQQSILPTVNYSNVETSINQMKNVLKSVLMSNLNLLFTQIIVLSNTKLHLQRNTAM